MSREGPEAAIALWRLSLSQAEAAGDTAGMAASLGNIGAGWYSASALDSAVVYWTSRDRDNGARHLATALAMTGMAAVVAIGAGWVLMPVLLHAQTDTVISAARLFLLMIPLYAVIGLPHPRWQERPLACVVPKPGVTVHAKEIIDFLAPKVAKWWLPSDVVFVESIPKTSVGKFAKRELRERLKDHRWSDA